MRPRLLPFTLASLLMACGADDIVSPAGGVGSSGTGGAVGSGNTSGAGGGLSGAGGIGQGGSGTGGDGVGGGGGEGGAPMVDTCPVPMGTFAWDAPSSTGSNTSRYHAVLQVADGAPPRVLARSVFQNGSFNNAELIGFEHNGPSMWATQYVAQASFGLGIATHLAATHGADPCITYNDNALRLQCSSISDRVIAASGSQLAVADAGTSKLVVYATSGSQLHAVEVTPSNTANPEPIASAWTLGTTSLAVDAQGTPHLAYVAFESQPKTRTIVYATKDANGWVTQPVDTDTWQYSPSNEGASVSLALDGSRPVIAYHHRSTESLKLARMTNGSFSAVTLEAPQAQFPNDTVGKSVALQFDCMGRLHVVYTRSFSTDPDPSLGLLYARIENDALTAHEHFPLTFSTAYRAASNRYGLGFHIRADGSQVVSAELASIYGSGIYFAER